MNQKPALYFYEVSVDRVKDGDTVDMFFDLGFRASLRVTVRLTDLDAPETWRPTSEKERVAGKRVTEFLTVLLASKTGNLFCDTQKIDLYGRALGTLYFKAEDAYVNINELVNQFMITEGITKIESRLA